MKKVNGYGTTKRMIVNSPDFNCDINLKVSKILPFLKNIKKEYKTNLKINIE